MRLPVRMGLRRLEKRTDRNDTKFHRVKFLHLGHYKPIQQYRPGSDWLENNFSETDLGALVDTKLSMSQQCAPAVKKAIHISDHISKSIDRRSKKVVILIYLVIVRQDLVWAPQYKKDMDILE